jgi:2-polyprenyl-3-methyl-5-hydroxy-6-metoxy-1,4-benzoquinol methylase
LVVAMGTAWLVKQADRQNTRNIWKAMGELVGFTDYSVEEVWRRWRESDKELARNWVQAAPDENDRAALAEWYRQNSELYMFAISGYNLDYKRICSNLKVLRKGQGACLDYGAGNGEIVLELARRGHASTYYDVEGQSAKFAQYRAQKQKLDVKFRFSKESLAEDRFDTIFSLDVLEHIPDLQAELNFLSSLLNAGGLLLFDVPAGATHSHPMHLNHNVDFRGLLRQKGMNERRPFWYALPFVKQEKFLFVAGENSGMAGKANLTTD